ncbi:methyltransferase [Bacteroidia bacterium]|nr:methyltransferase [Bacteroidia bacterium]
MTEQENKQAVKDGYNAIAQQYFDTYVSDKSDLEYFDTFANSLPKSSTILDVGCGMGHYSKYLYDKGLCVTGIDFSEGMLKIAKENYPEIDFINADVCNLKNKIKIKYDGIVITFLLHHLSKQEVEQCLLEVKSLCKPSTHLLLIIEEGTNIYLQKEPFAHEYIYQINKYTKEEISNVLSKCGFHISFIIDKQPNENDPYAFTEGNTIVVFAS